MQTIPQLIKKIVNDCPQTNVQIFRDRKGELVYRTFAEMDELITQFAYGLRSLGVKEEDKVGLISENRPQWLIADLAVMSLRAADVPRGCDSTDQEIEYILHKTKCSVTFAEKEKELERILNIKKKLPELRDIIVLDEEFNKQKKKDGKVRIHTFQEVLDMGKEAQSKDPLAVHKIIEAGKSDDTATIIFTSGTTGKPKGVILRQEAFVNQAVNVIDRIGIRPNEIWMSILPVWHSYERSLQYISIGNGNGVGYSKPIGQILLKDFKDMQPHFLPSVPRIWEALRANVLKNVNGSSSLKKAIFNYFLWIASMHAKLGQMVRGEVPRWKKRSRFLDALIAILPWLWLWPSRILGNLLVFNKIKNLFGKNFRAGISGGGALQKDVDKFFAAAGITLLEGYGLTESGPIIGVRNYYHPEAETVGKAYPNMQVKIVDEEGKEVRLGEKGIIMAKGPQIMTGYYEEPELTREVLSEDGWLNTGDLGIMTHDGTYCIAGRAKDTIVLLGGENIEPIPIEHRIMLSPYIDQAVVLGQDKKYLAALIVPNTEFLEEYAQENNINYANIEELVKMEAIIELYREILSESICAKTGFKVFEQIFKFAILPVKFEVNRELSAKQEVKRHVVNELYKKEIEALF